MSLGGNNEIAKKEFISAMRSRLEKMEPGMGNNVDLPDVADNLGALGEAVFKILTSDAEIVSNQNTDQAFWQWITGINGWLTKLSAWQKGITDAFNKYIPIDMPEQNLKATVTGLVTPGDPPALSPVQLKGKIE